MATAHLLLDRVPAPAETLKSSEPGRHSVIGEAVNDRGFLQALLSHGTFERYFYIRKPGLTFDIAEHYANSGRLTPITLASQHLLDDCGPLVLFTSSILFQRYASFRLARKHPEWPICGVTHTLSNIYPRVSFGSPKLFPYDALICTTPSARETLEHLMNEHAHSTAVIQPTPPLPDIQYPVIPLGIDPATVGGPDGRESARRELGIPGSAIVFLFLGRLSQVNKADLHPVIRVFFDTPGLSDESRLIIAGDDTRHHLASGLREFAARFDSPRTATIMPDISVAQKQLLLSAADVFLAISDTVEETFGISVVEAMMSGIPVIASEWNGYRRLVRHGSDGWLVPTYMYADWSELSAVGPLFDGEYHQTQRVFLDLEALSEAMHTLAGAPDLRRRLGAAARRRAFSEFTWQNVLPQYEELWREQLCKAAAAESPTDALRYAAVYDLGAVFRHYPTRTISPEDRVTLSRDCDRLTTLMREHRLFLMPDPAFDPFVDEQIIGQCDTDRSLSFRELAAALCDRNLPSLLLTSHICRLIKNGILKLQRTTAHVPYGLA